MNGTGPLTYEKIYFSLWELGQRYGKFTQFRVIGKSHDDRLIPMLELGMGTESVFCLGGVQGTDRQMPGYLLQMAREYCHALECNWELEEFYQVGKLLDKIKLCFIPLLNPDGYEVCLRGYTAVRNPVHRQMLRMQNVPYERFDTNARGINIGRNFPTAYYRRRGIGQEPASENETRALIRIFQEYKSRGLLYFCQSEKRVIYYGQPQSFVYNQKSYRLARHLQKRSNYRLERQARSRREETTEGSPERFYGEITRQPALVVEQPLEDPGEGDREYREIYALPLEYVFSLTE